MNKLQFFTFQLFFTKGFGNKSLTTLLTKYESLAFVLEAYEKGEVEIPNISKISESDILQKLNRGKIKFICFWEEDFPLILRQIEDFPFIIFFVGNGDLFKSNKNISIVGTRKITKYGEAILNDLVPSLKGNLLVSGMAFGTDAMVHSLSIINNIDTLAVLPFGCNKATPTSLYPLYKRILDSNGAVISEFLEETSYSKGMFARRNRIIAGISQKTIVIEASIDSGALITAELAFDYNREVYAYPGSIYSSSTKGCHYLVKKNIASLIESPSDLAFGQPFTPQRSTQLMDEVEKKVYYAILAGSNTLTLLSEKLGLEQSILLRVCTNLEISGILNTDNQNFYYLT